MHINLVGEGWDGAWATRSIHDTCTPAWAPKTHTRHGTWAREVDVDTREVEVDTRRMPEACAHMTQVCKPDYQGTLNPTLRGGYPKPYTARRVP